MTESNWSLPETVVLQRIHDRLSTPTADVLATIVDVAGNAYRRPGAKMLLDADGTGMGSITAGCLEDELIRTAEGVRESGRPEVVSYDLMEDDEEDVWGLGVGCNGIIEVLLEPLDETYRPAVDAFESGRSIGVCTVVSAAAGTLSRGDRLYYRPEDGVFRRPDGRVVREESGGSDRDDGGSRDSGTRDSDEEAADAGWPTDLLAEPAAELTRMGKADTVSVPVGDGSVSVFIDGLAAPDDLVIFGTGHDVGPVTEFARDTDFRVTVVGFRGALDLEERFPAAHRTVTTSPATVDEALTLDERTYALVMTHNFVDDQLTVESLLDSSVPYIGLMGPRERFERMHEAFAEAGRSLSEADRSRLYTPVGLDLGGGSPYQIAHSIVAEVLAVSNGRTPQHLKAREGHIHERVSVDPDTA